MRITIGVRQPIIELGFGVAGCVDIEISKGRRRLIPARTAEHIGFAARLKTNIRDPRHLPGA
jgi:hypothetical protein